MFTGLETWELVMFAAVCAWTALAVAFSIGTVVAYLMTLPSTREERSAAPARVVYPQPAGAMPATPTVSGAVG